MDLKNRHAGSMFTIVAPGPSVVDLAAEHLEGVVIALYSAVLPVEQLGYQGPVYSLQKDAVECVPKTAVLLLHESESGAGAPEYPSTVLFSDERDLGIEAGTGSNSAICAVRIARFLGAAGLRLVSFDSCVNGDLRAYVNGVVGETEDMAYLWACECLRNEIVGLGVVDWVTPERGDYVPSTQ